jgi:uncharacterized protein (DUF1499 family)
MKYFLSLVLVCLSWFGMIQNAVALPLHPAAIFSFANSRPQNLGVTEGHLAKCPTTANCVSSFSTDATHQVEPIRYSTSLGQAMADLKQAIQSLPNTEIIRESDNYLYAEFTSRILGFVDDVEFYFDSPGLIQVRSASRLGESDFGVNRRRVSVIRVLMRQLPT